MACREVKSACKNSGENRPFGWDLTMFCTRFHEPGKIFTATTRVRPKKATGLEYEASANGQTGAAKVSFPTAIDETVADGSITWTAKAISNGSLERTISSAEWIVPAGSGLVVDDEQVISTNGQQVVTAEISGGTAGQTYRVVARVTFSDGTIEDFGIDLEVK